METKTINGTVIRENNDGFLCVSDLMRAREEMGTNMGWKESTLSVIFRSKKLMHELYLYLKSMGIVRYESYEDFYREASYLGIIKILKQHKIWYTKSKGPTRATFCSREMFKLVAIKLFSSFYYTIEPEWLGEVKINFIQSIRSQDTLEIDFISILTDKIGFLADVVQKQLKRQNYVYDLYIEIFGKPIVIEYHEEYHAKGSQIKIDKGKAALAIELGYHYIVVPVAKERESLQDIKMVVSGKIDFAICEDINETRFGTIVRLKYAERINELVLGVKDMRYRNLATMSELSVIESMESMVVGWVKSKLMKTEAEVMAALTPAIVPNSADLYNY